jgi:serine/threonine-protein kinase
MRPNSAVGDEASTPVHKACAELADRLWAGEDCHAEDFFPALPAADPAADAAIELIYTEFVVREELGQRPSVDEWLARFPQWRDRLERMLQIGALFDEVDELLADDAFPERATVAGDSADALAEALASRELRLDEVVGIKRCALFAGELPATNDLAPPGKGPTLLPDPDPWIDQYELLEEIGHGGMGVVYKARQLALNRIVALKAILAGEYAAPDQRARFRREAENMARLRHPNIVPVYTVGERDGCPFFSMEYVEGGSLAHKIAGQPQPERQAAQWVEVLARAVSYAHQQGLVHRDLKPSNVVLTTDGVPKITDFGLAKFLAAESGAVVAEAVAGAAPGGEPARPTSEGVRATSSPDGDPVLAGAGARPVAVAPESPTVTGTTIGTPAYMAPEQAAGNLREVGPLTDVYALGTILYELLTGQPPFSSRVACQTLHDVQHREPPRPRTLNPRADADLEAICLKCLEKKPTNRYSSAEALAEDLARWLRGKPPRARPFLPWHARIRRSARRHPALSTIFVLGAITAIVAPTVAYFRDPARRLECIERTLAQGNPVTLIGESGLPEWSRWRTDDGSLTPCQGTDGFLSISTESLLGLLELLPDPQQEHYRFSAEVRQESTPVVSPYMGIYFAYSNYSTAKGQRHFFASLGFNDNVEAFEKNSPRKNNLMTNVHVLGDQKWFHRSSVMLGNNGQPVRFAPAVFNQGQGPWHKLAVEVTPTRFDYFWDDRLVNSVPRGKFINTAKTWVNDPRVRVPESAVPYFAPRGSLGLIVRNCTASFRRVVVEPLGEEK